MRAAASVLPFTALAVGQGEEFNRWLLRARRRRPGRASVRDQSISLALVGAATG